MDDLISRQAAIEQLQKELSTDKEDGVEVIAAGLTSFGIKQVLERLPSAQPERPKGEWIDFSMSIKGVPTEACGECGEWSYGMGKKYCPNCGAWMVRGEEDG